MDKKPHPVVFYDISMHKLYKKIINNTSNVDGSKWIYVYMTTRPRCRICSEWRKISLLTTWHLTKITQIVLGTAILFNMLYSILMYSSISLCNFYTLNGTMSVWSTLYTDFSSSQKHYFMVDLKTRLYDSDSWIIYDYIWTVIYLVSMWSFLESVIARVTW